MMKLYDETVYRAEQAKEERVRRLLGFCRVRGPGTFPDALDVALELSRRHVDERGDLSLADLLLEAGLAGDLPEAQRVALARPGVELASWLEALKWTKTRSGKRRAWRPPAQNRVTGRGVGCDGYPSQPVTHSPYQSLGMWRRGGP